MEPNNMAPETSGTQGQSVTPTGADAIEQALAEANVEVASAVGVPMDTPAKKSGHGMLIGLILCILLAIGGIGFGVWAMIDGNTQKTNLEKQISNLQTQNSQLLEQVATLNEQIENFNDGVEEGYRVIGIGECTFDQVWNGETNEGGAITVKCEATTSEGEGKFVYDTDTNTLRFVKPE